MSAPGSAGENELVVAEDGTIPADQLARLGFGPGAHLRVLESSPPASDNTGLASSLPDLPDVEWEAFEKASDLARQDLAGPS